MTCVTSGSSKQRTTCTIASVSRMFAEEFVAESLALGCALDEARDVDELHDGGHDALRAARSSASAPAARRALRPCRRSARRCRTDSSPHPPCAAVSALNSVDLPTLGSPTIPSLSIGSSRALNVFMAATDPLAHGHVSIASRQRSAGAPGCNARFVHCRTRPARNPTVTQPALLDRAARSRSAAADTRAMPARPRCS